MHFPDIFLFRNYMDEINIFVFLIMHLHIDILKAIFDYMDEIKMFVCSDGWE